MFLDENGMIIPTYLEAQEKELAKLCIESHNKVLELGARYGTVTYEIQQKLSDKNNVISVEPDSTVWKALTHNLIRNKCKVNIIYGFISRKKLSLEGSGYAITAVSDSESTIPSYTLEEIEAKYNIQFDTIVADCEGYLETFFDENPKMYSTIKMIIFEADSPHKCNYDKIRDELRKNGLVEILGGFQNVWKKPF